MSHQILGTLEQKIMDVIWAADHPLKPAEVLSSLGDKYAYTTIMTELKRMTDKKILKRQLVGKAYVYKPAEDKNKFIKDNLSSIYDTLVGSYKDLAISQFVDVVKSNKKDLELLKSYLKDHS
ncbi:BlaI/MecI/CopY family transcriptional regulator [Patescibacteria group bacterium]|nr:BlaI/MecI/CopY family transcriptional regulator [Patescibacteria group bacterium]